MLLAMTEELLVAIIAASAAITASIGAQIVAAIVTGKRARERLEFERAQWEAERFSDSRRIAFVNFLQAHDEYLKTCRKLYLDINDVARDKLLKERVRVDGARVEAMEAEISLIAPELYDRIKGVWERNGSIRDIDSKDEAAIQAWLTRQRSAMAEVRVHMAASLKVAHQRASRSSATPRNDPSPRDHSGRAVLGAAHLRQ
jgi:hypothetical protein